MKANRLFNNPNNPHWLYTFNRLNSRLCFSGMNQIKYYFDNMRGQPNHNYYKIYPKFTKQDIPFLSNFVANYVSYIALEQYSTTNMYYYTDQLIEHDETE